MNANIDNINELNKDELNNMIMELQKDVALLEYETKKITKDRILKQSKILRLKRLLEEKC